MIGYYWIVSYPKSGNTWLRLMLQSVRQDGQAPDFRQRSNFAPIANSRLPFDSLLGVASSDMTDDEIAELRPRYYEGEAALAGEPLLRKVHDAWTLTPAGEPLFPPALTLGTIYLVRDPRDIVASLAHHDGAALERTLARMCASDNLLASSARSLFDQFPQRLLSWGEHVLSWLDAPGPRPLLLRYEDMLAEPLTALRRAVDLLGWTADDAVLVRAVAATRFETLRATEERQGFRERSPRTDRFFRRGQAGGWREELTAAQVRRIEAAFGPVMERLGYL